MASQPLLQQPDVDLEAGQAGQAAQAAQAAEADDEPPARIAAYTGTFLGIPYARIINFVKELDLSYRPGYGRSLRSRRGLRLWLLPAVAMAHVVAEGCSRGFTMDVAHENFYFLSLFLAATLAPLFLDPSWVPDILMASAAAEHTWRNAMKVLGTAKPALVPAIGWGSVGFRAADKGLIYGFVDGMAFA
ncbi:unnamed protein product [Effrenium voratum]|nr:unnamed protein product [Effrenium voratum]